MLDYTRETTGQKKYFQVKNGKKKKIELKDEITGQTRDCFQRVDRRKKMKC